jgi:Cu/Ag efflux protein CusF
MKKMLVLLGSVAVLAGCGQQPANQTAATSSGNDAHDMARMDNMAVPAEHKSAKGSGIVTALDAAAGSITLDHGPIPEANWPAMTMAFKAKPQVLEGVKVGDKVEFDVILDDSAGEVTSVRKR